MSNFDEFTLQIGLWNRRADEGISVDIPLEQFFIKDKDGDNYLEMLIRHLIIGFLESTFMETFSFIGKTISKEQFHEFIREFKYQRNYFLKIHSESTGKIYPKMVVEFELDNGIDKESKEWIG